MPVIHLTKRSIDAIPPVASGQILYRDATLSGFGLRVGTRSRVFFAEGQVARRTVRVTIGKYGPLSPEAARKRALKVLGEMAEGRNPNGERKAKQASAMTVRDAFERMHHAKLNGLPITDGDGRVIGYVDQLELLLVWVRASGRHGLLEPRPEGRD